MVLNKAGKKLYISAPRAALPLLFLALSSMPSLCPAQEAAAVLSRGSGLYFHTFLSFQKALGRPITAFDLSKEKPQLSRDLKAVVAFGSKAANFDYPAKIKVIYLLAPGYTAEGPKGRFTRISSRPDPALAIDAYLKLQPGLKRLAVFFKEPARETYLSELVAAAELRGVAIVPVGLTSAAEMPDQLRTLSGKADAIWLLPDPALITKVSLQVLAQFSCSNKVPYYAPSGGLADLGAAGAVAPDLNEIGNTAASALQQILSGKTQPGTIYLKSAETTINPEFINRCGLQIKLPSGKGAE